jgi:hypothetical protein
LLAKTLSLEKRKSKNLISGQGVTNMEGKIYKNSLVLKEL